MLLVVWKWLMLVWLFGQMCVRVGIIWDSLDMFCQVNWMFVVWVIVSRCRVWLVELLVVSSVIIELMMVFLLMIFVIGMQLLFLGVSWLVWCVVLWVSLLCSGVFGLMKEVLGKCRFIIFISNWLVLVVLQKVQVLGVWQEVIFEVSSFL